MEASHARQRIVKDVKKDDERVQVTGFVEKVKEDHFTLNDKTGTIKVFTENVKLKFKENDLVNVIGDLDLKPSGEIYLKAQFIQDMNNLNFKYYLKLYELKKELEEQD